MLLLLHPFVNRILIHFKSVPHSTQDNRDIVIFHSKYSRVLSARTQRYMGKIGLVITHVIFKTKLYTYSSRFFFSLLHTKKRFHLFICTTRYRFSILVYLCYLLALVIQFTIIIVLLSYHGLKQKPSLVARSSDEKYKLFRSFYL